MELHELEIQPVQKRKRDEDGRTSESVIGDSETAQKGEHRVELSSHVEDTKASDSPAPGKRRQKRSRRQWYSVIPCFCIRRMQWYSSNEILAKLDFACPLPRKPSPPAPQFRLKQGHKLMFSVNYREPHYIFTLMAAEKKLQKRELKWPLKESFVLILHKTKDRVERVMEAHSSQPGETCCSLIVHENTIKQFGYIKNGMLHVILKLNPKTTPPSHPALMQPSI